MVVNSSPGPPASLHPLVTVKSPHVLGPLPRICVAGVPSGSAVRTCSQGVSSAALFFVFFFSDSDVDDGVDVDVGIGVGESVMRMIPNFHVHVLRSSAQVHDSALIVQFSAAAMDTTSAALAAGVGTAAPREGRTVRREMRAVAAYILRAKWTVFGCGCGFEVDVGSAEFG